ncbi:MarR family transcriptional regulator [Actinocrispum sp. NPDC049592]|uniref:MarR family winged helix-turn-helix transcriptional regulator n=1 Tax=Actinocrispum sp. NPDC049592 TaxID=3154835 RepID=UPI0034417637
MTPPAESLPAELLDLPSFLLLQVVRDARRIGIGVHGPTLRAPHLTVLAGLTEFGPASQKEISSRLRIDPSDLVSVLDDLQERGMINRVRDETDRRRYVVTIRPPGRKALEVRLAQLRELNEALLAPLSAAERSVLHELLARVHTYHQANPT